jgi:hypothetical protein
VADASLLRPWQWKDKLSAPQSRPTPGAWISLDSTYAATHTRWLLTEMLPRFKQRSGDALTPTPLLANLHFRALLRLPGRELARETLAGWLDLLASTRGPLQADSLNALASLAKLKARATQDYSELWHVLLEVGGAA